MTILSKNFKKSSLTFSERIFLLANDALKLTIYVFMLYIILHDLDSFLLLFIFWFGVLSIFQRIDSTKSDDIEIYRADEL